MSPLLLAIAFRLWIVWFGGDGVGSGRIVGFRSKAGFEGEGFDGTGSGVEGNLVEFDAADQWRGTEIVHEYGDHGVGLCHPFEFECLPLGRYIFEPGFFRQGLDDGIDKADGKVTVLFQFLDDFELGFDNQFDVTYIFNLAQLFVQRGDGFFITFFQGISIVQHGSELEMHQEEDSCGEEGGATPGGQDEVGFFKSALWAVGQQVDGGNHLGDSAQCQAKADGKAGSLFVRGAFLSQATFKLQAGGKKIHRKV